MIQIRPNSKAILLATLLFGLNAYVCANLFGLEFSSQMASIEGSYMTISRWAMDNWRDLTWFPLWFDGQPFFGVYQPGFHLSVAALAAITGVSPEHAYHFLAALAYCAVPVTLFAACFKFTGNLKSAFFSALLCSVLSPVCFFSPLQRYDAGGWLLPRRYQVLVFYGEAPHTAALAMIPFAVWAVHAAVGLRRRSHIVIAPLAVAAVMLTNWPGTTGLTMALLAYCLAQFAPGRRAYALSVGAIGLTAWLLVSPWILPSTLIRAFANAQQSDATNLGAQQLLPALAIVAVAIAAHFLFERVGADRTFRWFAYFALIAGAAVIGRDWFGWKLLPQPTRFQLEFDLAFAGVAGWLIARGVALLPRPARLAGLALLFIAASVQTRTVRRYARRLTHPIDVTQTAEYRMSRAFETKLGNRRVFAPGNVCLWMNLFNDVPQMAGCCDQGLPGFGYRLAMYGIYTGDHAFERDAEISILWMRAYGADAIGVTGPGSTEIIKPYWKWRKFEGVLPEVWREGDNIIYQVPRRTAEPVRVVPKAALLPRLPVNAIDVGDLEKLVAAMEDPSAPAAHFQWLNRHEALVAATAPVGDVVFLQIAAAPGWRAEQDGERATLRADPLGMMYIEPRTAGKIQIRLVYDGGAEAVWTRLFQALGVLAIGTAWFIRSRRHG
ncbi:MAG: hypothetical protein M3N93_07000 [Acidobacteriota bacterium]|nr:hypothetical protein [Acidobacteriota bacterium]